MLQVYIGSTLHKNWPSLDDLLKKFTHLQSKTSRMVNLSLLPENCVSVPRSKLRNTALSSQPYPTILADPKSRVRVERSIA